MDGDYPEITWFCYTSCDDEHPGEGIDWKEHMIYVNAPDDIQSTYLKTRRTYELLKGKVDYDWVVRTNTSVFVNVRNLLAKLDRIYDEKRIYSTFTQNHNDTENEDFLNVQGFFYMMPRIYFEIGMTYDYDVTTIHGDGMIYGQDDIMTSWKIHQVMKGYDIYRGYSDSGIVYWYRPCESGDMTSMDTLNGCSIYQWVSNPGVINDMVFLRLRLMSSGSLDNLNYRSTSDEISHFYEIYGTLK